VQTASMWFICMEWCSKDKSAFCKFYFEDTT